MRIIVQRAKNAQVIVNKNTVGKIKNGLLLLVGITHDDNLEKISFCAKKIANLRIFEDESDKLNLSVKDIGGEILSISQFTLYGDTQKGNRPSFTNAAKPEFALQLYEKFNEMLRVEHGLNVETGVFGAHMDVEFTNDGPVTLIVEK